MASVTDFKQFILKRVPEKAKEHSAIYNYLHCFCHDEQKLTTDLFTEFYKKALLFPYWQSRLTSLQNTLCAELSSFSKFHYSAECNLQELVPVARWQLIAIQKQTDLVKMVESFLLSNTSKGDRVSTLLSDKERVLGLILRCSGNLDVFSFGPLAIIVQGKLEPLSPLSELYYSPQYELRPTYKHVIEDLNLNFIHFKIKRGIATGYHCRHFYFQQSNHFTQNIKETRILFSLLKKMESRFIQSKSDPHYKKLIQSLHDHYRCILTSSDSFKNHSLETQQILSQAKKALKNLYPHDRLLFLLTANIDFHFRKQQQIDSALNPSP